MAMQMDSRQTLIYKVLAPYLLAFPESKLNGEGLAMYARVLDHLEPAVIDAAMQKCMRGAKFFPRPADIIEAAETITERASGNDGKPDAGRAWEEAMQLVKRQGYMGEWTYSCPEVEAAVKRFGRMELCCLEEKDVNTARAQFRDIYNSAAKKAKEKREAQEVLDKLGAERVARLAAYANKAPNLGLVQPQSE